MSKEPPEVVNTLLQIRHLFFNIVKHGFTTILKFENTQYKGLFLKNQGEKVLIKKGLQSFTKQHNALEIFFKFDKLLS
jgi:hypothetical protein